MSSRDPSVGVVGHVEWVDFAVVDRLPAAGEILHAREHFAAAGGGGAVAAVLLAALAGRCAFYTALGRDAPGDAALAELVARGVTTHATRPAVATRRAFTYLDDAAERTITVLGARLVPSGGDAALPWDAIRELDAVYFTGGDVAALRAARGARVLVATPRAREALTTAGVEVDVLVASANDPGEAIAADAFDPPPREVVLTDGARGGSFSGGRWASAPLPGAPVDAYGCGDAFAAGLTLGLGAGLGMRDALGLAARCGAATLCRRGPYGGPPGAPIEPLR